MREKWKVGGKKEVGIRGERVSLGSRYALLVIDYCYGFILQ